MGAENQDNKGWGRRIDGLIKRVGDEVGGERGEKVRERLTEAKSRVEAGLESDEARRVRGEMLALGDKAMERVDDALRHERTQQVVKRVDATLTEIGDRLRGDHTDSPSAGPDPEPPAAAPVSEEATGSSDTTASPSPETAAETREEAAVRDASPGAGDVAPDISTNGEDETPSRNA